MFFALFVYPITWILTLVFSLLPIITVPLAVTTSLASAGSSLYALNSFLPVDTFFTMLLLYMGLEVALLVIKFVRFLLGHLPFIGAGFRQ